MSTNDRLSMKLTPELVARMDEISGFLAKLFGSDPELTRHVASNLDTYGALLNFLRLPVQALERNYDYTLTCTPKNDERGYVSSFMLAISEGEEPVMVLGFDAEKNVVNIRGLFLDSSDDTSTRADLEAFQSNLKVTKIARFYEAAIDTFGEPVGPKSRDAMAAAKKLLATATSERLERRDQLKNRVPLFQDYLNAVLDGYDASDGRTIELRSPGTNAQGHVISEVMGFRYMGDGFVLQIGATYTVLNFTFGVLSSNEGQSILCMDTFKKHIRAAKDPAHILGSIIVALEMAPMIINESPQAEAIRMRALRLLRTQLSCVTVNPVAA